MSEYHRRVSLAVALIAFGLAACMAEPLPARETRELTEEVEQGIFVQSRQLTTSGDVETRIVREEGQAVLANAWFLSMSREWDYLVFTLDTGGSPILRGEVRSEILEIAPSLAELNARLVAQWREPSSPSTWDDIDDPGCDVVGEKGVFGYIPITGRWLSGIGGANHCMQNCCAMHDACFAEHKCTIGSMIPLVGLKQNIGSTIRTRNAKELPPGCFGCNLRVYACLGACRVTPKVIDQAQRAVGTNPCPQGQHRCYDAGCSSAFYCRSDCYTEPTPCEVKEAKDTSKVWCAEPGCRDMKGRMGYIAPAHYLGTTIDPCKADWVVTPCECPIVDDLNEWHGRCSDSSCQDGSVGFCLPSAKGASGVGCGTNGNVLDSPCCGEVAQPCCRGGGPKCSGQRAGYDGFTRDGPDWTCGADGKCQCGAIGQACCPGLTCSKGAACGGSGVCRACTPSKAACGTVTCGLTVADGCGGTISCGSCASGDICQNGTCVTSAPYFDVSGLNACGSGTFTVKNTGNASGQVCLTADLTACNGAALKGVQLTIDPCFSLAAGGSTEVNELGWFDRGHKILLNGNQIEASICGCP